MSKPVFAVADSIAHNWVDQIADDLGFELRVGPIATPDDVAKLTEGAVSLIVATQPVTRAKIEAFADSVESIGRMGVGLDNIDLDAAKEHGIAVVHQPAYAVDEVSNHAAAMILASNRDLVQADRDFRKSGWRSREFPRVMSLESSVLGVIGCGRIGHALMTKMRPFFKEVIGYDPMVKADNFDFELVKSVDDLAKRSDVISLHSPLTPETKHIIDARVISLMKDGAMLVNVSRGGLIDEDALYSALKSGKISSSGLDVFENEPLQKDSSLYNAPNLILTSHIAWYSEVAGPRLVQWSAIDVFEYWKTKSIKHGRLAVDPRTK
ncbi:MAG: C-terminal binding protein [Actinobacteria bacterium]|nr:C-terminal binding protein [Actinomycetota bacterium]